MADQDISKGAQGGVHVELDSDPCVNYALQQNHVPVIRRIRLRNAGSTAVRDLLVRVSMDPALAVPLDLRVDSIVAGGMHTLEPIDLPLSASRLVEQVERQAGVLKVEVSAPSGVLGRSEQPIDVLAYNEWGGTRVLPEILAALVLPNHPTVQWILRTASEILARETGDGAISAYQSRSPERVRAIVRAVYGACAGMGIAYITPPASFETAGQKVRTPDQIATGLLATCLDLTLLFAAALEQAGLHPLLLLPKGHALVGVWLVEDSFPQATVDEVSRIRKRIELGEILAVETTHVTAKAPPRFEEAVRASARHLADGTAFHMAIDVRAARRAGIRPIPQRVEGRVPVPEPEAVPPSDRPQAPVVPSTAGEAAQPASDSRAKERGPARLEAWKRKLLDLSLRNRLLNHRETKATIPLLCPSLAQLEDRLAEGAAFELLPVPEALGKADPRRAELMAPADPAAALGPFLRDQLASRRLHASLSDAELEARLTHLYRGTRESMEEGGSNTLFLALGFLRWFETKTSTQPRLAPILLLPLQLERRTVLDGFRLKLSDEDPQVNVTLLQMMSRDFGVDTAGLDSLEEDEAGLDVPRILDRFRRAVLRMDRWEIVEHAVVGQFSFTKYLMWIDLEKRSDRLLQNVIVKHLVETPERPFAPDTRFPELESLDADRDPASTFCPLDADSSQLRAVFAAADGATFVLEGPPGTGKSQTITNLIANAVAAGQRVLFVSEKIAALNVVKKRLTQVGLGPFCLELHSNKAQKRVVMEQLKEATRAPVPVATTDWAASGERLRGVRAELNAYADALHSGRRAGLSVHQAIARLVVLRDVPRLPEIYGSPETTDAARRDLMTERAHDLELAAVEVGAIASSPWRGTGLKLWEPGLSDAIADLAQELRGAAVHVEGAAAELGALLGIPGSDLSHDGIRAVLGIARFLATSPAPTAELLGAPDQAKVLEDVAAWLDLARLQRDREIALRQSFREEALALDLVALKGALDRANASVWPLAWWRARAPRGVLGAVWSGATALPARRELAAAVGRLQECRAGREALASIQVPAHALLGVTWRGSDTDRERILGWILWAAEFRQHLSRTGRGNAQDLERLRGRWIALATEDARARGSEAALARCLAAVTAALDRLSAVLARIPTLLECPPGAVEGPADAPGFAARLQGAASRWLDALPLLRSWCAWRRARGAALEVGLERLVEAVEQGRIPPSSTELVFEKSFLEWWLSATYRGDKVLAGFSRAGHEDKIRRFRNLDIHVIETAHEAVTSRVAGRLPRGTVGLSSQSTSEMGLLQREIQRQRGHLPLRKLFQRVPNVVARLKPCFLMSPLSVAQYLDPEFPLFDLVVFDEASQIPVYDAIGAIARGKRLIVVGDSKQLPPTNFFNRTEAEDDLTDEAEVQDLESILDECRAAQLPSLDLRWHYRSRHESLIAFSNRMYYENGLLTFPSARLASDQLGIAWRHVAGGVYDRGRSRTNRAEAEAVVAHLLERLLDPARAQKSVGIVTFSVAQQILVEDLLDVARRRHPEIEPHFDASREEPVFVKNLESVQGDERDVVLFSICYGPDQDGGTAMNFGPLNRDGGQRRLNVAITRAREALVVFSSLRGEQIDLARSRAVGVRHLKDFLDYAERGISVLGMGLDTGLAAECESPFEEDVKRELERRGWVVQAQVGCSGYRVDLGVRDPTAPGRFLLGVECDGAMYHSGKTARDRDRLRQAVLEGLGWQIYRLWSTDWWQSRNEEIGRLVARLEDLRRARQEEVAVPASTGGRGDSDLLASAAHIAAAIRAAPSVRPDPDGMPPDATPYRVAAVPQPRIRRLSADRYYDSDARDALREQVLAVLDVEAPIELSLLAERILPTWGLARQTPRALDRLRDACVGLAMTTSTDGTREFCWRHHGQAVTYNSFRVPGSEAKAARDPRCIPPEEVSNAAAAILRDHVRMDRQSLARELGRLFGFSRMGNRVEAAMSEGIEHLMQSGRAITDSDQLHLAE